MAKGSSPQRATAIATSQMLPSPPPSPSPLTLCSMVTERLDRGVLMYGEAACIIDQKLRTKIAKKRDQTQTEYSVGTIYIHTYIHIYIYIYIYICVCVCVYMYLCITDQERSVRCHPQDRSNVCQNTYEGLIFFVSFFFMLAWAWTRWTWGLESEEDDDDVSALDSSSGRPEVHP